MTRIRQSDGAAKGYPRTPADDYGTSVEGVGKQSPVLNEAQLIRRNFKLTGTLPPQVSYAAVAQDMPFRTNALAIGVTPGGRVVVAGGTTGWPGNTTPSDAVAFYDPSSGLWTSLQPLPGGLSTATVVAIDDNTVLVGAGVTSGSVYTTAWYRYDLTAGTRTTTPAGPAGSRKGAVKVADGRIIAFPARTGDSALSDVVRAYDPVANTWTNLPNFPYTVGFSTACVLDDGRVFVFCINTNVGSADAYMFDPITNASTQVTGLTNMPTSVRTGQVIKRSDGKVYIVCTATNNTRLTLFDPVAMTFTALANPVTANDTNAAYAPAALLPDGRLVMCCPSGGANSVRAYDPVANTWSSALSVAGSRRLSYSLAYNVALPDGRVLMFGGGAVNSTTGTRYVYATTAIYDPVDNAFDVPASAPSITLLPTVSQKAGAIMLFAGVSWHPLATFEWRKNGVLLTDGTTTHVYSHTLVAGDHNTNLTLTINSPNGNTVSPNIPINIIPNVIGFDWAYVSTGRQLRRVIATPDGSFAKFIAIDTSDGNFHSSNDLITWTNRGLGNTTAATAYSSTRPWRCANGVFLAFAGDNNFPVFGINLATGAQTNPAPPLQADGYKNLITGADYGNGMWMAVMSQPINRATAVTDKVFFTSVDNGATWTRLAHAIDPEFWSANGLVFANGAWHASFSAKKMKSTDDGANWVQVSTNTSYKSLQYNAARGKFYAINTDIGGIDESTDFATWTNRTTPTTFDYLTVTDSFFIGHRSSVFGDRVYYSTDGISWQTVTLTTVSVNSSTREIAYGDGRLVFNTNGTSVGVSP